MVEVYANRDLGQLIHAVLSERYRRAGTTPPRLPIAPMGEFLDTGSKLVGPKLHRLSTQTDGNEQALQTLAMWDSDARFYLFIMTSMSACALLSPQKVHYVTYIFPHLSKELERFGYDPLTDDEIKELSARALELMAVPVPPGATGAAGEALYCAAGRALPRAGRDQKSTDHRTTLLLDIRLLCNEVEATYNLAERKALASRIGEMVSTELRRKHVRGERFDDAMTMFWMEFGLLFAGSRITAPE